jgi:hypothetical protein
MSYMFLLFIIIIFGMRILIFMILILSTIINAGLSRNVGQCGSQASAKVAEWCVLASHSTAND